MYLIIYMQLKNDLNKWLEFIGFCVSNKYSIIPIIYINSAT